MILGCFAIFGMIASSMFLFSFFLGDSLCDGLFKLKKIKISSGKIRCSVCGKRLEVHKEYTYEVVQEMFGTKHFYDCIDCPKCGCQIVMKERKR